MFEKAVCLVVDHCGIDYTLTLTIFKHVQFYTCIRWGFFDNNLE